MILVKCAIGGVVEPNHFDPRLSRGTAESCCHAPSTNWWGCGSRLQWIGHWLHDPLVNFVDLPRLLTEEPAQ